MSATRQALQLESDLSILTFDRYEGDADLIKLEDDFAISRDANGEVLSLYKDDVWVLSPYKVSVGSLPKIFFNYIKTKELIEEAKRLLFIIMLHGRGRNGSMLAPVTVSRNYYNGCIVKLAEYGYIHSISIKDIFEDKSHSASFAKLLPKTRVGISAFVNVLKLLDRLDNKHTGINFSRDSKLLGYLAIADRQIKTNLEQTEVIPTSILSATLQERWQQIAELESKQKHLLKFIEKYLKDKKFASEKRWKKDVAGSGLATLFDRYNVSDRNNFSAFIKKIQGTCKHLVHAYSGMRHTETLALYSNCLETTENKKTGSVTRLLGITTKFSGSQKAVKWVTSKDVVRPIQILLSINKGIASHHNMAIADTPLFISTSLLARSVGNLFASDFREQHQLELRNDSLIIKEQDILQLEEIEPFRDWRNDPEFEIGKPWRFKSHQYRRSLVVYSLQSGLVSLGGLQIQMKHIFREMTLYYGNGASAAKKLFDIPRTHIATDMQSVKDELGALSYIKNVIFSDEKLFGVHGTFVEKNLKGDLPDRKTYIFENRDRTIQQFKKGELAYKETAIGGCVSTKACDSRLTRSITACINCEGGILKEANFVNIINKQKEFIAYLDKDSIEYRTEMDDLDILEDYKQRLIKVG